MSDLPTRCREEIEDLHRFFMAWLAGTSPDEDAVWERLTDVLAPEFMLISPGGTRAERDALLASLRAAHGARPGLKIWIEGFDARLAAGDLCLVTYEEHHEEQGERGARFSSALFRERPGAPHGVAWVHVHETAFSPPGADAAGSSSA